jgi:hypothetical protein
MTIKNEKDELLKKSHERLVEIGQILFQGIKRLKYRENQKNHLNQLDSKERESVHGVNTNSNQYSDD